jgi:hypothetical protein
VRYSITVDRVRTSACRLPDRKISAIRISQDMNDRHGMLPTMFSSTPGRFPPFVHSNAILAMRECERC